MLSMLLRAVNYITFRRPKPIPAPKPISFVQISGISAYTVKKVCRWSGTSWL